MRKAWLVIGVLFVIAGSTAARADEGKCELHAKALFDQSGRVVKTGPGSYCDKAGCKSCAFPRKESLEGKDSSLEGKDSEKKGCCFQK